MRGPAPITVEDSLWPLVVIRYVGTPTLAQFEEGLEKRAAFLRRSEPHLILVDAIRGGMLPAEWLARRMDESGLHETATLARHHFGLIRGQMSG
jgi:hypothetical protein